MNGHQELIDIMAQHEAAEDAQAHADLLEQVNGSHGLNERSAAFLDHCNGGMTLEDWMRVDDRYESKALEQCPAETQATV